ncbi:MAG: acyl carrier protein [Coprococcus sp.]|nr:acyl carrier protein [Coprococcus sp.]
MEEIFNRLKVIIGDAMPDMDMTNVTMESSLKNDLGINSLGMIMLALLIEEKFAVSFDETVNFETVEDICAYIRDNMPKQG